MRASVFFSWMLLGLLLGSFLPAEAATSGIVVDPDGQPVKGARVCLMVAGREGLCAETDERGYYEIPLGSASSVRILADGFVNRIVPAIHHEEPIVLERAASVWVHLIDALTKRPIPKGEVVLILPTGRQRGPVPCSAAGVRIRRLPAGTVMIKGRASGYRERKSAVLTLEAGRETEVTLRLRPAPEPDSARPSVGSSG